MINLMQGDCLELMKGIPDESIDMILCDLPYGSTNCKWDVIIPFDLLWKEYERVVKKNSPILLFGAEPFASQMRLSNRKWFKYDWIWDKVGTTNFLNAKKMPLRRHETICVFCGGKTPYYPQMEIRGKPRKKGNYNKNNDGKGNMVYGKFENITTINNIYYPCDILQFSNAVQKGKLHPTQKPVALLEYLIKTYTKEGETVLDNCAGSMSTVIACLNTNRNCIAIEKSEEYFLIGKERVKKHMLDNKIKDCYNQACRGDVIWQNLKIEPEKDTEDF